MLDQYRSTNRQWMFYAGPSMNPTLRASDILHVVPCADKEIRIGDVIVFTPPEGGSSIVHRVVSKDARGVRTRGDNNACVDPHVLEPHHILGLVVHAQRGDKLRRVHGGAAGRVIGNLMNLRGYIDRKLSGVPAATPHRPNQLRAVGAWFLSRMHPRIVRFSARGGSELQMLVGRHLIARRPAGEERWVIRRRYRLFIDEATLPIRDACVEQHEPV
jgi:signal peptidase I